MKKIIYITLVLAMILQCVSVAAFAAPNKKDVIEEYSAKILNVKGGASAIVTMTFDDGTLGTANTLLQIMQDYNMKASLMVNPSRIEGGSGASYANLTQMKSLTAAGYLEVQSHSYSHTYIAPPGHGDHNPNTYDQVNTPEFISHEVLGSYNYLRENFPQFASLSFAVPGSNSYNDNALAKVHEVFFAARRNQTPTVSSLQTLNPAENANAGGWFNLKNIWLDRGVDAVNAILDASVNNEQGAWLITSAHEINNNPSSGNHSMTTDNFKSLLDNVKAYVNEGKVWVATFSEAIKYLREYQNATVYQYETVDGMFVEVDMNKNTAGGKELDPDVFDMPLTVKVEIPEGWDRVRFRQNGVETVVDSFEEGGLAYALVDVVPGSGKVSITDGSKEIPQKAMNASIPMAPNGTKAIASLTFDDGLVQTAKALNTLFEKYGSDSLCASLMMLENKMNATAVAQWNEIFAKGYLQPESHSTNHHYIVPTTHSKYNEANNTAENIENEVVHSRDSLRQWFPNYDVLTYAIPNSVYTPEAYDKVMQSYYAARGGECVLTERLGKMMTLDPKPGRALGDWYNPYIARLITAKNAAITPQVINDYLVSCINNGGWFIGMAHGVVEGENMDINTSDLAVVLKKMQHYVDNGQLWVATYGDATRYIRERQNSTVNAYTTFDGMYVDLTMSEHTSDGLYLDPEIFNMPITVKLEMPSTWGRITYSQPGGKTETAYCFEEGGLNYVYVNLVPNGGTATIRNDGDPSAYLESIGLKQNVSEEESLSYNLYVPKGTLIEGVYLGKEKLKSVTADNYLKYSVGNINIKELDKEYNLTIKFTKESGYVDWSLKASVLSYFDVMIDSDVATDKDKQLAFDFLNFAKATRVRFAKSADNDKIDELLARLEGFTASTRELNPSDLGTANTALMGASFVVNEKPYYAFYIKEGFTGTVTFTYDSAAGPVTCTFEIVNGYYHCKRFVVVDVKCTYDLIAEITIVANGKIADADVNAEGKYSLDNYLASLTEENNADYANKLYSYALSANKFMND